MWLCLCMLYYDLYLVILVTLGYNDVYFVVDTPATCTFEPDDYCYWNQRYPNKWYKLIINKVNSC